MFLKFKTFLLVIALTGLFCLPASYAQTQLRMGDLQAFSAVYPQLFSSPEKVPANAGSHTPASQDPTRQLLLQSYMGETNYYQLSCNLKTNLNPTMKPLQDIQIMLLQQGLSVSDYDNLMQTLANNPQILSQFVSMLRQNRGHLALLQLKQRWPNFASDLPTTAQRVVFRDIIESLQGKQNPSVAMRSVFVEQLKPGQPLKSNDHQYDNYSQRSPQILLVESSSSH